MNERKGDFHRWIVDEWVKVGTPKVLYRKQGSFDSYIRLWIIIGGQGCGVTSVVNIM